MPTTARRRVRSRPTAVLAALVLAATASLWGAGPGTAAAAEVRVLHVGSWHGQTGEYATVAEAVAAAHAGDWILVGPGDYHERMDYAAGGSEASAGLEITTPGIHLRGMDRNQVVVDGTKPGAPPCSSAPGDQDAGPSGHGRDGLVVFEASDVSVDNLTVCNFPTGNAGGGNEIWFNGGDGTGTQNLDGYEGSYLSATATAYTDANHGEYGIFVSNTKGPGSLTHTYGSNMADGAYYVGACPDCNTVIDDAHAQYSALGYSGTNSGGRLVIKGSEFDHNKTGFSTNSQNNDDAPSPQDGACPAGTTGPTGTTSCWEFTGNYVHDNNNANAPGTGTAELGPIGTGIVIAGGRNDIVKGNRFEHNDSWAVLVVPYIDTGSPPPIAHCDGGIDNWLGSGWCYYATWGNEVADNTFLGNGSYANYSNGDLADLSDPDPVHPGNCWHGNTDPGGVSSTPTNLQATNGTCGKPNQGGEPLSAANLYNPDSLTGQVVCATGILGPCATLPSPPNPPNTPVGSYPAPQAPILPPLAAQTTMPDPCAGVPGDAWCPPSAGITVAPGSVAPGQPVVVTSTGWQAGSTVQVVLGDGALTTALTADQHGTVTGTLVVPPDAAAGPLAVVLTGTAWGGGPLEQRTSITVVVPSTTVTTSTSPPTTSVVVTPAFTG